MWIVGAAALTLLDDHRFYMERDEGGGMIGQIIVSCALVAVIAIKTHRMILQPEQAEVNPPTGVHFRYGCGWFILSLITMAIVGVAVFGFGFGFGNIIANLTSGPVIDLYYWVDFAGLAVELAMVVFVVPVMYLFYRLGMGLPHLAVAGQDMPFGSFGPEHVAISLAVVALNIGAIIVGATTLSVIFRASEIDPGADDRL